MFDTNMGNLKAIFKNSVLIPALTVSIKPKMFTLVITTMLKL